MGFSSYAGLLNAGFENMHGSVHVFVGGHMGNLVCSPSDPIFWMHHAFVDCIWQKFRDSSQITPLTEYPSSAPPAHDGNDNMIPFTGLRNIDGMNTWTSLFYQYVQFIFNIQMSFLTVHYVIFLSCLVDVFLFLCYFV